MTFEDLQRRFLSDGPALFAQWCCKENRFDESIIDEALSQSNVSMKTIYHFINRNGCVLEPVEHDDFDPEMGGALDDPFPDEHGVMTVVQLREACKEAGLPTNGKKADLIARLKDASDSTEAPAEAAATEDMADPAEAAAADDTPEGDVSESEGENSGSEA